MDNSSSSNDPFAPILRAAAGSILKAHGIQRCEWGVVARLGDALANFLRECGARAKAICEHANRTEILPTDVALALIESGMNISTLRDYKSDGTAGNVKPIVVNDAVFPGANRADKVVVRVTQAQFNALRQSQKQSHFAVRDAGAGVITSPAHPRPAHVPDYLPSFPASHTYVHTAARREPDAFDLATRPELISSQKIAMQRSLVRLVARKTHSRRIVYRFAFPGDDDTLEREYLEDSGAKRPRSELFDDPNELFLLGDLQSEHANATQTGFQRCLDALLGLEAAYARPRRAVLPDASAFLTVASEESSAEPEVLLSVPTVPLAPAVSGRINLNASLALGRVPPTPTLSSSAKAPAASASRSKNAGGVPKRVSSYTVAAGEATHTTPKRTGPGRPTATNTAKFGVQQRVSHGHAQTLGTPTSKKS